VREEEYLSLTTIINLAWLHKDIKWLAIEPALSLKGISFGNKHNVQRSIYHICGARNGT
jgi:hypothetical protein